MTLLFARDFDPAPVLHEIHNHDEPLAQATGVFLARLESDPTNESISIEPFRIDSVSGQTYSMLGRDEALRHWHLTVLVSPKAAKSEIWWGIWPVLEADDIADVTVAKITWSMN